MCSCALEQEAPDHAGAAEPLVVQTGECGRHDPDFVCPYRVWDHDGLDAMALPYCAMADLDHLDARGNPKPPMTQYRRLVIAQHGRGSDADKYLDIMKNAGASAVGESIITPGETFVLAPQFIEHKYACDHGLTDGDLEGLFVWPTGGGAERFWAWGGQSSPADGPFTRGSFELLEKLLDLAFERMPNIQEVIFAGQSAGGQFVQRYAAVNTYDFDPWVRVRYVPANPYTYLYVTPDRPTWGDPAFAPPSFAGWPDTEVCTDLVGVNSCSGYDDYGFGLATRPNGSYIENMLSAAIEHQFSGRDVTYLVGEMDITHAGSGDCACSVQVQGEHRRARAEAYVQYATEVLEASHQLVKVPDHSHGGTIFEKPCGYRTLFGRPELCDALQEHTMLPGWGDVLAIAHGNVDADPGVETALVLSHSSSSTSVVVMDDADHGNALLYASTSNSAWARWTDVALGDVNGDGRDELAMSRTIWSGDSWFVLRHFGGGSWSTFASGGADWTFPRSATSIAFGDIHGDGKAELAVARGATSGTRWYVYKYTPDLMDINTNPMHQVRSGGSGWASAARVTDLAFGDTDGDGAEELAVARDATSGTRALVYGLYPDLTATHIGSGWAAGNSIRAVAFGDVDGDDRDELIVGRDVVSGVRWLVLDDEDASFDIVLSGGDDWSDQEVTSIAVGRTDTSRMFTVAVGTAATSGDSEVHLLTLQMVDEALELGDAALRTVASPGSVSAVSFGDVDGLGGAELIYGVSDVPGFSLGVVPAP